jgi:hypothetical protein
MVALTTLRSVILPEDLPEEIQFKTDINFGRQTTFLKAASTSIML